MTFQLGLKALTAKISIIAKIAKIAEIAEIAEIAKIAKIAEIAKTRKFGCLRHPFCSPFGYEVCQNLYIGIQNVENENPSNQSITLIIIPIQEYTNKLFLNTKTYQIKQCFKVFGQTDRQNLRDIAVQTDRQTDRLERCS